MWAAVGKRRRNKMPYGISVALIFLEFLRWPDSRGQSPSELKWDSSVALCPLEGQSLAVQLVKRFKT